MIKKLITITINRDNRSTLNTKTGYDELMRLYKLIA